MSGPIRQRQIYTCPVIGCGKVCKSTKGLTQHLNTIHPSSESESDSDAHSASDHAENILSPTPPSLTMGVDNQPRSISPALSLDRSVSESPEHSLCLNLDSQRAQSPNWDASSVDRHTGLSLPHSSGSSASASVECLVEVRESPPHSVSCFTLSRPVSFNPRYGSF
jgi:hypothetical protein